MFALRTASSTVMSTLTLGSETFFGTSTGPATPTMAPPRFSSTTTVAS